MLRKRSSLRISFTAAAAVSPALKQHVEDLAFVIDRAPEVHPFARHPEHHLVEVPAIARPRTALPQPSRDYRAEFQNPAADALVGEVEPTLRKQLLDVAIAQGEAQVKPNRVLDHNRREPVPAIRNRKHSSQPTAGRCLGPVNVTMPARRIGLTLTSTGLTASRD